MCRARRQTSTISLMTWVSGRPRRSRSGWSASCPGTGSITGSAHERRRVRHDNGTGENVPTVVPLIAVAFSVALLVLTADARAEDVRMAYAHAAIAAATALIVAGFAVSQCRVLVAKAAS